MATLLNNSDLTYVSFPISKVDKTDDGDLLVWGKATDGSVDSDAQIVDPAWSAKALDKWLSTGGNVRVMHSTQHLPAGKGVEVDSTSGDGHWVRSLVVEPIAKKLVEKGVLTSYSIGIMNPRIVRDAAAKGGRIVDGIVHELSLVDRPANSNCKFALVKSADGGGAVDAAELFGDTDALLAEVGKKKKPKPFPPADDTEPADGDQAGAAGAADSEDAEDGEMEDGTEDLGKSYQSARDAWLSREPTLGETPASGTEYLAKRAGWQRWHAEGDAAGLDGTSDGYARWLAAHTPTEVAAEVADVDVAKTAGGTGLLDLVADPDPVVKAGKDCPKCGKTYHADAKMRRCEGCGKKLPRAQVEGDMVEKTTRTVPADVKPAGAHREPDGDTVEALERDAGMPTHPDGDPDRVPASVKGAGYGVQRMHDALCAAYSWDAVAAEYPALKGVAGAVDPTWFSSQAGMAVGKGDMQRVAELANAAQSADVIAKGELDPALLQDARAEVHKSFTDLYPTAHPTPSHPTPGMWQRPYLSAGHAPLNVTGHRAPNIPPATNTPDPDDFHRGLLTAGHEAASPSNKGDNLDTGGTLGSGASRTYYRNASREAARVAMQSMHDHISSAFPDMCPMAASKAVMPADMGDTNRPTPVMPAPTRKAPGEKTAEGHLMKAKPAIGRKALARLIKSASRAAADQAVRKVAGDYETTISALQAEIEELGAQPDPAQAPQRGVLRKAITTDDGPAPVGKRSLVEEVQAAAVQEQREYIEYLRTLTKSSNPATREQAEGQLNAMLIKTT